MGVHKNGGGSESLLVFSVYAPRAARTHRLTQKIQRTRGGSTAKHEKVAAEIIRADEHTSDKHGLSQDVRGTFPLADVFVRMDLPGQLMTEQIRRALRLWFGDPFVTPRKDEHGMFTAQSAALRSADLSRQVGAVIASAEGEILSLGCNEVPRPGGGAYWEGDEPDYRDFQWGVDENQLAKRQILREVLLKFEETRGAADQLVAMALEGETPLLKGTRLASLLEFGRVVHAEMHALMDAARRGVQVCGTTLFCTTFPCHVCARHIIASGVRRIVYIEPYPKSMTQELYGPAVCVEDEAADPDAVRFEPFLGVAPRSYMRFFTGQRRKDGAGYPVEWKHAEAQPRVTNPVAHLETETSASKWILDHAAKLGL